MLNLEGQIVTEGETKKGRIEINTDTGLIENITETTGQADIILDDN
jgi:hypothetical protein